MPKILACFALLLLSAGSSYAMGTDHRVVDRRERPGEPRLARYSASFALLSNANARVRPYPQPLSWLPGRCRR